MRILHAAPLVVAVALPATAQPPVPTGTVEHVVVHGKAPATREIGRGASRSFTCGTFTNLAASADTGIAAGTITDMIPVSPDAYATRDGSMDR